jgi:hypothetical protein
MEPDDAELVTESQSGNRDAFRQIVERYQTLISTPAYCATCDMELHKRRDQFAFDAQQLTQCGQPGAVASGKIPLGQMRKPSDPAKTTTPDISINNYTRDSAFRTGCARRCFPRHRVINQTHNILNGCAEPRTPNTRL